MKKMKKMQKNFISLITIIIILFSTTCTYARDVNELNWPDGNISSEKEKKTEELIEIPAAPPLVQQSTKDLLPSSNILPSVTGSYTYGCSSESLRGNYGGKPNMERYILELNSDAKTEELKLLKDLGCEVEVYIFNLVQVLIPHDKIEIIRNLNFIKHLRNPSFEVEENSKILKKFSSADSNEFATIHLDEARKNGYMGQGIKIAILDTAFEPGNKIFCNNVYYTRSFRSQDKDIRAGDIDHGNSVAEIITRVAPKTKLILVNFQTDVEYIKALKELINMSGQEKPNVIITAVNIILPDDYYDGSGLRASLARLAREKGITMVVSAGNNAMTHYIGSFTDMSGNLLHNFAPKDKTLEIEVERGDRIRIVLTWKDNWDYPSQDLEMGIFNDDLQPLQISSMRQQKVKDPPYKVVDIIAPYTGTYHIAIKKIKAYKGLPFMIYIYSLTAHNMEYINSESSLDPGLPPSSDVITVGAVQSLYPSKLEPWSSQGKTTDNRIKPDIVAPGGIYCNSIDGIFSGTSSAAPQVAGAIALLLSKNPTLSPARLKDILKKTAQKLGTPDDNPLFGAGLMNIYKAMILI